MGQYTSQLPASSRQGVQLSSSSGGSYLKVSVSFLMAIINAQTVQHKEAILLWEERRVVSSKKVMTRTKGGSLYALLYYHIFSCRWLCREASQLFASAAPQPASVLGRCLFRVLPWHRHCKSLITYRAWEIQKHVASHTSKDECGMAIYKYTSKLVHRLCLLML